MRPGPQQVAKKIRDELAEVKMVLSHVYASDNREESPKYFGLFAILWYNLNAE
jgi:hypothetical protein